MAAALVCDGRSTVETTALTKSQPLFNGKNEAVENVRLQDYRGYKCQYIVMTRLVNSVAGVNGDKECILIIAGVLSHNVAVNSRLHMEHFWFGNGGYWLGWVE